jgi:uncharacterized phiE125 gp8 family phage protein
VKVVTQPIGEPISLDEAKNHLRIDQDDDDALIRALITAARKYCELVQGRVYAEQTLEETWDYWPSVMKLPMLQSVESITYKDSAGTVHTVEPSIYAVDTDSYVPRVVPRSGQQWPPFIKWPVSAVRARYVAGYETTTTNGVWEDKPSTLAVSISGLGSIISAGAAFIEGVYYESLTSQTLTHDAGEASDRIDRVVLRLDIAAATITPTIIKGTAAATPVAPALVRAGNTYDIPLAQVLIKASASVIFSVTDEREYGSYTVALPEIVKQAMLLLIAEMHEMRENSTESHSVRMEVQMSADRLLQLERVW